MGDEPRDVGTCGWSRHGWNVKSFGGAHPFRTPWLGLGPYPDTAQAVLDLMRRCFLLKAVGTVAIVLYNCCITRKDAVAAAELHHSALLLLVVLLQAPVIYCTCTYANATNEQRTSGWLHVTMLVNTLGAFCGIVLWSRKTGCGLRYEVS